MTASCSHEHTGSCSPNGVYLYVKCMDCGELLCISDVGNDRLYNCPGYSPSKTNHNQTCLHCGFNYWDHQLERVIGRVVLNC